MPEPEYQRLFLPDVAHAHGEDILLSGRIQELRQVVREGGVTVRMVAEMVAVEPHIGIHIDAVELDGNPLAESLIVEHEMFAIPAGAAERVARGRAAGAFRRERADHWKIRARARRRRRPWRSSSVQALAERCRVSQSWPRQVFEAPVMGQVEAFARRSR